MFMSPAFAADATAAATQTTGASLMSFVPLIIVVVIFYLFLVRPQQKRMAEYQKLVAGLRRGDRVVTTGGLIGTIHRVDEKSPDVQVEIAEGVRVRIQRNAIAEVLAKGEPVAETTEKKNS